MIMIKQLLQILVFDFISLMGWGGKYGLILKCIYFKANVRALQKISIEKQGYNKYIKKVKDI